jgi:glutathione S-transferase
MSVTTVRGIPGSPFMRAVLITLIEKGAPYKLIPVAPGQHKAPEYMALHPFGRIPVIEHEGFVLYETQAILRYLDRVYPAPALTPADPKVAARMDQAMNISDWYLFRQAGIPIGFNRVVAPRIGAPVNEAVVAAALPEARTCFANIETFLGDRPYMAGDQLSLADLHMAPQVDMLADCAEGAEMLAGTRLAAWLERMRARPSVAATTWDRLLEAA